MSRRFLFKGRSVIASVCRCSMARPWLHDRYWIGGNCRPQSAMCEDQDTHWHSTGEGWCGLWPMFIACLCPPAIVILHDLWVDVEEHGHVHNLLGSESLLFKAEALDLAEVGPRLIWRNIVNRHSCICCACVLTAAPRKRGWARSKTLSCWSHMAPFQLQAKFACSVVRFLSPLPGKPMNSSSYPGSSRQQTNTAHL